MEFKDKFVVVTGGASVNRKEYLQRIFQSRG